MYVPDWNVSRRRFAQIAFGGAASMEPGGYGHLLVLVERVVEARFGLAALPRGGEPKPSGFATAAKFYCYQAKVVVR